MNVILATKQSTYAAKAALHVQQLQPCISPAIFSSQALGAWLIAAVKFSKSFPILHEHPPGALSGAG